MGSDRIEPANSKENSKANDDDTYDMIVSFISKGAGIDRDARKRVDKAIADYNSKNKTEVTPEMIGWGREGEVDYNFHFKNLSTSQKKDFVSKIKAAIGASEDVYVSFNKKSVHKR